jgi:hypothetical protein
MGRPVWVVVDGVPALGDAVLGEPNAADLVAWLQERPDLAVEVVGRLRVAGPWERVGARWSRVGTGASVRERAGAWRWEHAYFEGRRRGLDVGDCPTREAAQAAADAALVAAGWALAGGAR